ncbi:MAG: T9SS type A sorting domain-containing protein [Flavobacteriales bacterium]|nr:T9SS type A sorting domain-containing protein [Flavobacteriales bacterium]MBK6943866.1 T9SS type A sorting domain-containing protein [Flavobacteriales bacterium]MBK7240076.1 T9SS type A sorting domain-containing protein [Flavobacteriales bacterium]MBK9535602.1 T9SS type A sorting domain-containing protein [Flavobacteriales bacterium]MBP9138694.1 T9SS type A sorting domain-containing protein [Flavobacteriales bacterium]
MVRIVLAGLGCLLFISASTQWVDWSNQYPYAGRRVYAHTMHRTSDGNLLLCASIHGGWTTGSGIPFEDPPLATYLLKTQPNGDTLWTQRIDSLVPYTISHVVDLFDGNTLIAGTASMNWTYCGFAYSTIPMPQVFAMKIDQQGTILWRHVYDLPCARILADAWETDDQEIHLLALDTQEPNIVVGYIQPTWFENYTLDTQGNTINMAMIQESDPFFGACIGSAGHRAGRYLLATALDTVGQNNSYVRLGKLDDDGVPLGFVTVTDSSIRTVVDIITTVDNGLLMTLSNEYSTSRLIHTDTLGATLWDRQYATRFQQALSLSDGTYLLVGTSGSFVTPDMNQLCVTAVAANGDSIWSRVYGDSLRDRGTSMLVTNDGFVAFGTKDMYSGSVPPRLFLTWDTLSSTVGIAEYQLNNELLLIYPVPADQQVRVQIPPLAGPIHIEVIDATGKMSHQEQIMSGAREHVLYVSDLSNGNYTVIVRTVKELLVGRLVVAH